MKYCLSSRQPDQWLKKADQIKVQYRDRKIIFDLIEKFPEAEIVLEFPLVKEENFNWKEIVEYQTLSKGKLICCLREAEDIANCINHKINKYYYGYPIATAYDANEFARLGVCYLVLDAPLFFKMDFIKKAYDIPVRAAANVAYRAYVPRANGVCGTWIRPEDQDIYAPYVEVIEFEGVELNKEQTLFHIYAENKNWPGDLKDLILNLNYEGVNRLILDGLATKRLNCGQRCQETMPCNVCYRALDLANVETITKVKEALLKN